MVFYCILLFEYWIYQSLFDIKRELNNSGCSKSAIVQIYKHISAIAIIKNRHRLQKCILHIMFINTIIYNIRLAHVHYITPWFGNLITGIGPTPDEKMELQYGQDQWVCHPCLHKPTLGRTSLIIIFMLYLA